MPRCSRDRNTLNVVEGTAKPSMMMVGRCWLQLENDAVLATPDLKACRATVRTERTAQQYVHQTNHY